jgi:hypothetical protein
LFDLVKWCVASDELGGVDYQVFELILREK